MEVNNLEIIKKLLTFENEDDFYHCQILKRKKEHPELGSNSYVVKTYFIKSLEDLDRYWEEMRILSIWHTARVGITLNKRNFEAIAFHTLKKVTDQIMNKDWKSVRKAFTSVCGAVSAAKEKRWILDVDEKTFDFETLKRNLRELQPIDISTDKVLATIPTVNGWHVITSPFNVEEFKKIYRDIDIQKDNPTLLYYNDSMIHPPEGWEKDDRIFHVDY